MSTVDLLGSGILEITPNGGGYLRSVKKNLKPLPTDPQIASSTIGALRLRSGVTVEARVEGNRVVEVASVEGADPRSYAATPSYDDLSAIDPHERFFFEVGREPMGMRVIDLFTPVGRGQRGLIVAPPRSGKTVLLQQIAASVAKNHPEIHLFVLLVDERPEEVTEMKRSVKGEVFASTSDQSSEDHIRLAQLTLDRARRIVERGGHVLVLLDSLTRLARAYNKGSNTGRTMTGGVDIKALDVPKRLFGAARALDEGGSLTILATCLVETGSKMDEVIFQEFKGTGNMELVLDRRLADRRVWPAIDLNQSGTRKEERLLDADTLRRSTMIRRTLADLKPVEAMEGLIAQMSKHESNEAFFASLEGPASRRRA